MLKTPSCSLLCDPFTGKFLDFSGPRELPPLPGDGIPKILNTQCNIPYEMEEHCERIIRSIMGKAIGEEEDISIDIDPTIPQPFMENENDPEDVGWIQVNWESKTR